MTAAGPMSPTLMDRIYRPQRRIYDLTRKYYLFGRDRLLDGMAVQPGETRGGDRLRNRAQPYSYRAPVPAGTPDRHRAIVGHARHRTRLSGPLSRRRPLAPGTAETLTAQDLGLRGGADHILFSYVLSMVADPATAIDRACRWSARAERSTWSTSAISPVYPGGCPTAPQLAPLLSCPPPTSRGTASCRARPGEPRHTSSSRSCLAATPSYCAFAWPDIRAMWPSKVPLVRCAIDARS